MSIFTVFSQFKINEENAALTAQWGFASSCPHTFEPPAFAGGRTQNGGKPPVYCPRAQLHAHKAFLTDGALGLIRTSRSNDTNTSLLLFTFRHTSQHTALSFDNCVRWCGDRKSWYIFSSGKSRFWRHSQVQEEGHQGNKAGGAEGFGQLSRCPIIKAHRDKTLVRRSLFGESIICTKHPPRPQTEHEPVDKLAGLMRHELLKIKIKIAICSSHRGYLTSYPGTECLRTMTRLVLLVDL